jgi:HlyD family secretion protein
VTRRILIVLVCALAVAALAAYVLRRGPSGTAVDIGRAQRQAQFRSTVTASGEIVASQYADIGSSAMGKITALPVSEGERVKAGQVLAEIDRVQAASDVTGASEQAKALEAEQRAAQEQLRAADADAAAAEARAADAAQVLKRRRELAADQLVPASELDSAVAAADAAKAQVEAARAAADRARASVESAARRLGQSRAQLVRARDMLSKTSIVSPIDGVVTRLRVRNGEMVVVGIQNQPGTTLMTISDLAAVNLEVKVAEADVLHVARGQKAEVTLEALPGKTFDGTVVEIGASALPVTGTAAAREFRVVIRIENPEPGLLPGLTGDADIVTSERTNVITVPLQSVVLRTVDGKEQTGVFTVDGGVARFVPVTTGVIGGLDMEVSGIAEGTPVVTGPYQVLRELEAGAAVAPSAEP